MTTPERLQPQEEALASWLCAYDDAQAEGRPGDAPAESDLPPELRPRWRRARGCVDLLNQLWPRQFRGR